MAARIRFRQDEVKYIKSHYSTMSDKELSLAVEKEFGAFHPPMSIRCVRERKGWKKMKPRASSQKATSQASAAGSVIVHLCL